MAKRRVNPQKKYKKEKVRVKRYRMKTKSGYTYVSPFYRKYPKKPKETKRKLERGQTTDTFVKDKNAAKRDLACALR